MPNLLQLPPPPIRDDTNDFVWQEWFRQLRDDLSRATWKPALEILDTTASVVLPTTATVYKPPTPILQDGFTYDPTTGVIYIQHAGSYTFNLLLNTMPSSTGKKVFFYIDADFGGGFSPRVYSGREQQLQNNVTSQILISSSNFFPAGSSIRMYVWAEATVELQTVALPGGSASVPACRVLWS